MRRAAWQERRRARQAGQAAPDAAAALPTGRTRRGLVRRRAAELVTRQLAAALGNPRVVAIAAGVVVGLVTLGVILGAALVGLLADDE